MKSRKQVISSSFLNSQGGFTLVELMVGLAIGLLVTLVITQVFGVFEVRKRTTTGVADAQTNGSIALFSIQREMQLAGYPLMPTSDPNVNSPLKCTTLTINGTADTTVPNKLTPVTITDGTSDSFTIRYGDTSRGGIPSPILGMNAPNPNDARVESSFGCIAGDRTLVISADGSACAISTANSVVAAGSGVNASVNLADATAAAIDANLACLGAWNEITYAVVADAVVGGVLERNGVPLVEGIVNLQAQYGISTDTNPATTNEVSTWVNATAPWDAPTSEQRSRIKAVRVAVVARTEKMEAGTVTSGCSGNNIAAPTGLCAWAGDVTSPAPQIDLSADPDWQRYRYRVFETIIPLRNVIWNREAL